ncbi:MAG: ABC-three component system middle component 8 [bacterium]
MLKPTKHTAIQYSVIYISGIILKKLQENGILKYDDLKNLLIQNIGVKAKSRLNSSLTFLFALDKIEYLKELDAISITKQTENEIS